MSSQNHTNSSRDSRGRGAELDKAIVDNFPDGVFVKNEDGRYLFANEYITRLFWKEGKSLTGHTDRDMFSPEHARIIEEADAKTFLEGSNTIFDHVPSKEGFKDYLTHKVVVPRPGTDEKILIGYASDITALKRTEQELARTNYLLGRLMSLTPHIVFIWDIEQKQITHSNPGWEKVLGYSRVAVESQASFFWSKIHPNHETELRNVRSAVAGLVGAKEIEKTYEWRIKTSRGRYKWCRVHVTPFEIQNGEVLKVMAVLEDIDQIKKIQEKYRHESQCDALTGLANRRAFETALQEKIDWREQFCVLFVDLNKFKAVNDTYGHKAGDAVLIETAKRLKKVFRRRSDIVARLGGDEFVILSKGHMGEEKNEFIEHRLREAFADSFVYKGQPLKISPSFGLVEVTKKSKNAETVLQQADKAMYRAKNTASSGIVRLAEVSEVDASEK